LLKILLSPFSVWLLIRRPICCWSNPYEFIELVDINDGLEEIEEVVVATEELTYLFIRVEEETVLDEEYLLIIDEELTVFDVEHLFITGEVVLVLDLEYLFITGEELTVVDLEYLFITGEEVIVLDLE